MRALPDYHLHTYVTEDSETSMTEHVMAAAARGITEVAITDHYVLDLDTYRISEAEVESNFREAEKLKTRTGVNVRLGLEVDYFAGEMTKIEKFINKFDFDIILGSAHFVDGFGVPSEPGARGLLDLYGDPLTCYRKTLEAVEVAADCGVFDVMAHIDVVRKFLEGIAGRVEFDLYAEHAERVARAMARSGTGFEINCRGFDHSCAEQYPSAEFLKVLRDNGNIDVVTIGSDSHFIEHTGKYLRRGARALRDAGFDSLCLFRKRKPEKVALSEFDIDAPDV